MNSNDPLYSTIVIPENREFQIKQFTRKNMESWHIRNHYHDIYEIVLYEEIHGCVYLNGEKKGIYRNKLLYLPPYSVHGFDLQPKINTYIVLHLSPLFLNNKEKSLTLPSCPILLDMEDYNYDMINQLLRWGKEKLFSCNMRQETINMILLWITEQNPNTATFKRDSGDFTRLLKLIDKQKNFKIRVEDAAKLCNMSRSSFYDHFKKQFGTSFTNFLLEKRIEQAQYLLIKTDKSCTEISADLEFSDASHFSKIFRKQTGILPGDFKKRLQS